jgi:hypothetical protein
MKESHPGLRLQWSVTEIERIESINSALREAIWNAPCLVSRPGEGTYECRHDRPCRVCEWRKEVMKSLKEEFNEVL